ncbi:pyridoxal kinase PdxY [Ferrimonas balearica]|uniref:pyridoxal kinase PdxY n=1 Tax=Ferrimonas balearica TaxID=44012 RepID=UPI001C9A2065|nr:pyridoxal kinase PdxY [Ferrimonas balearica]MBY5920652.1 pyridoxal kinase PdxY [Ferrimonas balearica]MBY5996663.1 pyridoxal kinase PdxY [Ferrimonas balearica]
MNILSIQSHVAYGHAGNASAVFPLQRMGLNVWPVYTVMFSNHTGHGEWRGPVFAPETVSEVIQGIEDRGVLPQCSAVLSGYLGDPKMAQVILDAVAKVRAANPDALYCCDPVIGDVDRGIFVRPGVPEHFRDAVIQHADILTPNHFETEFLTGKTLRTLEDALEAGRMLLAQGPKVVLITSLLREDAPEESIEMLAISEGAAYLVRTPRLTFPTPMNGSGDATTALFLAKYLEKRDLKAALEHVAGAMFALFNETHKQQSRELLLVAVQDQLVDPAHRFEAYAV